MVGQADKRRVPGGVALAVITNREVERIVSGVPAWALQLAVIAGIQPSGIGDGRWPGRRARRDGRTFPYDCDNE